MQVTAVPCGFLLTQYPTAATVATMTKETLTSVAIVLILAVLGAWLYHRFFYTGNRRKPPYRSLHSYAPGRKPIVWIDWEEQHGDRILTFADAL